MAGALSVFVAGISLFATGGSLFVGGVSFFGAGASRLVSALENRLIHVATEPSSEEFLAYAIVRGYHPTVPAFIEERPDMLLGKDRGRIWRIVPEGHKRGPKPDLTKATPTELVGKLAHPIGWHRTTAQRLPGDFIAIDARGALDALGLITGETVTEDIIHRIFHDFCVGK